MRKMPNNISRLISAITFGAIALPSSLCLADEAQMDLVGSYYGRIDFFSSGASFTSPGNLMNGADCLKDSATLNIPSFEAGAAPKLVAAYLYWAGSLFENDGDDLFVTADLSCKNQYLQDVDCDPTNEDHMTTILKKARESADDTVELLLPGQEMAQTIKADDISMYGYYKSAGDERGTVAFFMAQADITSLLKEKLSNFSGDYTLRGLTADICNGREASCGGSETCSSLSLPHSNASASFSLVLVLQDPSWRLRRVALYQGLRGLNSSKSIINLDNIAVSDPPNGKLSYYIMEGDATIDSKTDEWIKVNGGAEDILLSDGLNPIGNPYNGTINSNNISGLAGVDVDQFDISKSLKAGSKNVDITFSTGSDRVVLGAVNVSVGVFSPVLEYDSSLVTLDQVSTAPALEKVHYLATLSNTGNLDANAEFIMVIPDGVKEWGIEQIPAGAVDASLVSGGDGQGIINIKNIAVPSGKVAPIHFYVVPSCKAQETPLVLNSTVTYDEGVFDMDSPPLTVTPDKGDSCPKPLPPDKPDAPLFWQIYGLRLEGGGGCNGLGGGSWLPLLLLVPWLIKRRDEKS